MHDISDSDLVVEELIVEMQSSPTWAKSKMTTLELLFFSGGEKPKGSISQYVDSTENRCHHSSDCGIC